MNSYPPELLAQLAPVMFVAGLDVPQGMAQQPPATPTTPQSSAIKSQDPFHVLILRLREALIAQRKVAIWQPEKSKTFQVVLVDKEVRFPPRKLVPPEDPQYASAHSPLSPLTPSSPLHPDGLIAPIWIRKHTTLLPSVFVMFLRLYEHPPNNPKSPLEGPDADREREREAEERRRDADLSAEIGHRKKSTNERNIKLTVVLLASRKLLDDPTLDARLTHIRRHSGLDSRAALFVLSPVSPSELGEFVKSLSQALYDPALEYYTTHSKRVRRKRNRHSTVISSYPNPPIGNITRPLRPEGWTVRYEYKMACFAEFRGEDEVVLKHYQDAYGTLLIMFGSPAILPPRTKRWAEAKVLADTINIKIAKLYLYNNEHSLALSNHSMHMRKFGDFSRGWGIGEETFEFWSWMARQNRIFAELLEQGTRSTLVIPVHKPQIIVPSVNSSQILTPSAQRLTGLDVDSRPPGINPSSALQHPGFYYYAAARCTEMRRVKFQLALEAEQSGNPTALSPGFTNEKKVDHNTIILELYTKAYELFKKYNPGESSNQGQGRLTLWIAYRIAQTYCNSGQYEMAIRFFERIAKTYRREQWGSMLMPLLTTWYACAKQLGDVELSIRLLLEMIGHDTPDPEDPNGLEEDLVAVLQNTVPGSPDAPFVVDLADAQPMLKPAVVFWSTSVTIGEAAGFQISLTAPSFTSIASLPFSSLQIYLDGEDEFPITIRHSPEKTPNATAVQWVKIDNTGNLRNAEANLRWNPRSVLVVSGTTSSDVPTVLRVARLVLTLEQNTWKIELPLQPSTSHLGSSPIGKWLSSLGPPRFVTLRREQYSSTIVKHRPHELNVSINHSAPAYLDEVYPITVEVTNVNDKDLDITLDILLQPTEIDAAINTIIADGEQSPSLIRGVHCGVVKPGVSVSKTLRLVSTGAAGDRMLDISVRSRTSEVSSPVDEEDDEEHRSGDVTEKLQTIVVPTLEAFRISQDITQHSNLKQWDGLADQQSYEEDYVDKCRGAEALVATTVQTTGPWPVYVEGVCFEEEDSAACSVVETSISSDHDDVFPGEFLPGDEFNFLARFNIPASKYAAQKLSSEPIPGHYKIRWRRILQAGEYGELSETIITIPVLEVPQDSVVALLDVPPTAKLHVPITISLSVRNYHSSQSANILCQLETDIVDTFVVSGLRSGRLPILLPGAEETIVWRLIPMECGHMKLPKLRVFNRRKAVGPPQDSAAVAAADNEGDIVEVVDVRRDHRQGEGEDSRGPMTILVLP